jgi:predicted transcriptional regulator
VSSAATRGRLEQPGSVPHAARVASERISVTLPREVRTALRALAEARKTTVSAVVADAVAHQVRMSALDRALREADRRFGPVPEAAIQAAMRAVLRTSRKGRARKRRAA